VAKDKKSREVLRRMERESRLELKRLDRRLIRTVRR